MFSLAFGFVAEAPDEIKSMRFSVQ